MKKQRGITSRSTPRPRDREVRLKGHVVKLTNQNKIYWPKEGITKGDVADYYERMHKLLLPHLKDRPESLNRMPNGIDKPGFFHKNAGGEAPAWVSSVKVHSGSRGSDVDYLLCNDLSTLLYMANLGCIELNPWNSRVTDLHKPDHLVIDLDPSAGNRFEDVVEAALAVKVVLDKIQVKGWCKTSGSTGLHVYVPVGARHTYEELAPFAKDLVRVVQQMLPKTTTLKRSLAERGRNKIYLDHLQNRFGQTVACVYSLRPRPGAPVSTPLEWKEVRPGLDPRDFNIGTIEARVRKKGDLFSDVRKKGSFRLRKAHAAVMELLDGA